MVFYFVQRGETLYAIAKRYQTTVHAIVAANRLEDPNAICPGQALIIPRPGEVPSPPPGGIVHLVRPGETVFHLATKFKTPAQEILRANQIAHPEFIVPGQQLVIPEKPDVGEDWPMYGRTPGRVGASPVRATGPLVEGWSCMPRKQLGVRPSSPVVRYDRIYVGLGDGQFYSLDRQTGRVKWRFPAIAEESAESLSDHPLATPAIYDGLAYLCTADGVVHAVDAYSGQHVWRVATGAPITSSPAVADGAVYFGGFDHHLYALEAKTGAIMWKCELSAPIRLPVSVGDEQVFAVTDDAVLWGLDANGGELIWRADLDRPAAPQFAEVILLASDRAFNPKTGQQLWQVDSGETSPVVLLDQVVYPGGVVDLFTGHLRPCRRDPKVPLSDADKAASELEETADGHAVIPALPLPRAPVQAVAASPSLLVGVGADGQLYQWRMDTTAERTITLALGSTSDHPPTIVSGQVLVSLVDGSLRTYRFQSGK